MKTLTACCTDPDCATHKGIVDFIKLWGFAIPKRQTGQRMAFDVDVPDYWNDRRRKAFKTAIRRLQTTH